MARLNHKKGRKSNYLKSLNTTYHRQARENCLFRDKFICQYEGCTKKHGLEFHHINYSILRKELEDNNLRWCVMLCEEHHQKVHKDLLNKWNPKNNNKKKYNE